MLWLYCDSQKPSKEQQAAVLAARKARLAQAVKRVEQGTNPDDSETRETLYAGPSDNENLNFVTDSLLMGCSTRFACFFKSHRQASHARGFCSFVGRRLDHFPSF